MLTPAISVLYLHGFASSPQSRKARFFQARLRERGIPFEAPDLADGDFFRLTISKQLEVVRRAASRAERLVLIGSSLGGYLAALYAAEHKAEQLILLAPAFGFYDLWVERLGPEEIARWQQSGRLSVFHYGLGRETDLSYALLEDAQKYEPYPNCQAPSLIFHGTHDELVPLANSARFVEEHRNAHLLEVNSGHELTDVLEQIWAGIEGVLPTA